jgi:heat shock protein HtpX
VTRIALFLLTNLGVMLVASAAFKILGIEPWLAANGVHANLTSLLLMCAIFGFGGSFISLLLSKTLAKRSSGTRIIEQAANSDEQWLLQTVAQLAQEAGIQSPEVGIFPSQQANAFATGWNKNAALVAVSAGLLQRFSRDEVRAVLAHEIGHVANGDMVTLSLIQGVVNTFVMFFARIIGHTVDRVLFKNERGYGIGFWIATFVAEMVLGILATIIVMWFSRFREYRADEAGARFAGRQSMIKALQRLKAEYDVPNDLPGELTAFGINGGWKKQAGNLFASHPPLDNRIAALLKG